MAAARGSDADALPVLLRFVAVPLFTLATFLLFLHLGFPYHRLSDRIADRLGRTTGAQIQIAEISPRLSLGGPGLAAVGVSATPRAGARIDMEHAFLRPAWSFAWLRGTPALHLDLTKVELTNLPLAAALPGASLRGLADIRMDLVLDDEAPEGASRFSARDGSLRLPGLPVPVPFTSFEGELAYGGENQLALDQATLTGPLVTLVASGTVGHGASFETSPLSLEVEIAAQPDLQAPLQAAGIALGADGKARLNLSGTPGRPEIR
jgi:hypothetical protein